MTATQRESEGYSDRPGKAAFVWRRYRPYLEGRRILDVGADQRHLARHLDPAAHYWGVGLGGEPDQELDLEGGVLPFGDREFDTVLCLDVLEHLESLHRVFDECCRVAAGHLIVALPNAWAAFFQSLRLEPGQRAKALKFYGLPLEPPADRRRWFFSDAQAEQFLRRRGARNGWDVVELDYHGGDQAQDWKARLRRRLTRRLLHPSLDLASLGRHTLWAVLARADRQA
ncbi:MAG: class I SAM-dependent methyltransferase [Thermodesulfobacteriota bacterium]